MPIPIPKPTPKPRTHPKLNALANQLALLAHTFTIIPIGYYLVNFIQFWDINDSAGKAGLVFFCLTLSFGTIFLMSVMNQNIDTKSKITALLACISSLISIAIASKNNNLCLIEGVVYTHQWYFIFGWMGFALWGLANLFIFKLNPKEDKEDNKGANDEENDNDNDSRRRKKTSRLSSTKIGAYESFENEKTN